jgi:adenine-specific DNA-methyltransferase
MTAEEKAQKARGAFFTPPEISQFLVDWALRTPSDRILEPSCGDAAFLIPAALRLLALGALNTATQIHGIDIHTPSVESARSTLKERGFSATIQAGDFFDQEPHPKFDAVVGNPPFVRYQDFSGVARAKILRAALSHGVRLTSLASSWAAFTIHASEFLNDTGRLGLVLPAELLSVNYASEVRRFLLGRFAKVRLVLFEQLVFPGVLEDVVLLLAEGRGNATHFEVYQARDAKALATLDSSLQQGFTPLANEKWTPALIPTDALETYRQVTGSAAFSKLMDWGNTYLGSVTGNNDYFTLSPADFARAGLSQSEVLKISPPGARHLRGLTFTQRAWDQLAKDALHIDSFNNPGSNEIEWLFKTVGISDVWTQFKAIEPDRVIFQSVNAIVLRRNQIAHGKADATITLGDAQLYVQRAERIAEVFEQLVCNELNYRLTYENCWDALEHLRGA